MDFNIEKLLAWRCCLNYPVNIKWIDLKNESTINLKKIIKKIYISPSKETNSYKNKTKNTQNSCISKNRKV